MAPKYSIRPRSRTCILLATMLTGGLVVSSCSTLPRDTSPQVIRTFAPVEDEQPATSPEPGQEPDLLLRDFFSASAVPAGDYKTARQFMTEKTAAKWDPQGPIIIVDSIDITTAPEEEVKPDTRSYQVRGTVIGTLQTGGSYVPERASYESTIDLVREDDQWRIADLPEGVVIERNELRNQYQPTSLFFLAESGKALVSDRRWIFSGQNQLDAELITLLMEGPSKDLEPATRTAASSDATFAGIEDGTYQFTGMSQMSKEDRLNFGAQLTWTLAGAGIPAPYKVMVDGAPLAEGLAELEPDDFADLNPRVSNDTIQPLYALAEGNLMRVNSDNAEPLPGRLGSAGDIQSADISDEGNVAAVRRAPGDKYRLGIGEIGGAQAEAMTAKTISRPTFEMGGQAAWVVVDGEKVVRVVRSSTTGEAVETRVDLTDLEHAHIEGDISIIRLSPTDSRVAMIIDGGVYIGVVDRRSSSEIRVVNVRGIAPEIGGAALTLDWQPDGSLAVGTSSPETPVWRVEQDGSSASALSSGNVTAPVVTLASSPSTLFITDQHAMLQLHKDAEATFWREVPGMQGVRSAPIVAS